LKNSADVNLKDFGGRSALMYASFEGHSEIVKMLIDYGADINTEACDDGVTVLMSASSGGHLQIVRLLLENGADICIIHSQYIDRPNSGDEIKGLQSMIDKIHRAGLLAGISTHKNSTIELCEKKYDLDVYLYPMNKLGFVYPGYEGNETVGERLELIKNTNKQFIIMKSLAAGRISPLDGLKFVLDNIKENDIISLGLGSIEEAMESIEIAKKYIG